ncbi:hypothetical protein SBRCBS47491_004721 [Sporothrix bragantina]|uniref:non-specific serine/threonine protein kinase n=1 Tax=Sporothrix bragantina TaxID=671064 RepID=A0ABP0BQR5_9PEZI
MPLREAFSSNVAKFLPALRPRSAPRVLPTAGFDEVPPDQLVEEETMPEYRVDHFYPVHLGEVFHDRYQVLAKLVYGSSSTIWLARDLQNHQYVALKVYIHNSARHRELPFYQHLATLPSSMHPGAKNIRQLLDSFQVAGPHGTHMVLVM